MKGERGSQGRNRESHDTAKHTTPLEVVLLERTSFLCLVAMGSTGLVNCYWCLKEVFNAYIPDGIGVPLCGTCIDKLLDDDGGQTPERPSAICHRSNALKIVLGRAVPHVDWRRIASFLEEWHRPGAGSRRTPVPPPYWCQRGRLRPDPGVSRPAVG